MTQVLIVEDQKMIRESLENMVTQTDGLRLAGSLSCAALAEQYCMRSDIDLILMDICTENDESGFVAAEKIKKRFPTIKIIIITSMLDYCYLDKARNVGAESIWFKDASAEELLSVITRTIDGECVYTDKMPEVSVGNATSYEFSEAEIRVLRLLVEGMTYKEMAQELCVTPDCVKAHVSSMLSKTGYSSKTKLAAVVTSKKLIVNGF